LARDALVARGLTTEDNVGVLGFSHGGWTITHVALEDSPQAANRKPFAAAVAYYPLCLNLMNMPNKPAVVPTLILIGTADTWTAPTFCEPLVERSAGMIQMHLYEGATHAFDYQLPTRTRMLRSGPTTMGYDDAYTKDSVKRSMKFLLENLKF
jgi:dienelactone hydrolase